MMAEAKFKKGDLVQFRRGGGWSLAGRIRSVRENQHRNGTTSWSYRVTLDELWHAEDKIRHVG